MNRTAVLRVLLVVVLFAGFALGGIVVGNVVAGDDEQTPQIAFDEDGAPTRQDVVPAADGDVPGGQQVALEGTAGSGGGGSGGSGNGSGGGGSGSGSGGGGRGAADSGNDQSRDGAGSDGAGADGQAPAGAADGGAPDGQPDAADQAPAGDAGADPLPRLEHEGLIQWLDECAGAAADDEGPAGCPEGVGAQILGELSVPFAIEQVAVGPTPWARAGCNPQGSSVGGGLEVVVATSHPASVTVEHGPDGRDTDEGWNADLASRTSDWEAGLEAGRTPRSITCVLATDVPDGPRPYVLDVTAVSALDDAEPPRATEEVEIFLEDRPQGRPPVEVNLLSPGLDRELDLVGLPVEVRVPASSADVHEGRPRRSAYAATVPATESCQGIEAATVDGPALGPESSGDVDLAGHPEWDPIYDVYRSHVARLEEGQAFLVCVWWTEGESGPVVEREQRVVTMPDLTRWRVRLDRVRWNDDAESRRFFRVEADWPGPACERATVAAPDDPAGVEEAADVTLCDSEGGLAQFIRAGGTDGWVRVVSEDELCISRGESLCGGAVDVSFDDKFPPSGGNGWLDLRTQLVHGNGDGECVQGSGPNCLQYAERTHTRGRVLGQVHVVVEPYDVLDAVDASRDGVLGVGPGEDFTSPVLVDSEVVVRDTGDPLHPAADVSLTVDRPVAGTVQAITYERGCESKVAPIAGAGPGYVVSFADLCPGARYRFMAQLVDTARIGRAEPGEAITTYYAYDPGDWPGRSQDAEFRSWPAGSARTPALLLDITATARIVNVDEDGEVELDRFDVSVGRLALEGGASGECSEDVGEPRSLEGSGRLARAVVPIEVDVDVSTSNACGGRRPGRVASIRGLVEVSLFRLASGSTSEVIVPDRGDGPRVTVHFDEVRVAGAAGPVPEAASLPPLER